VSGPEQDQHQRLARNVGELLQELRVAQNGVQVLFGFLLSVAFTDRYPKPASSCTSPTWSWRS
jgi:hypothetical protein